jgi:hypothetical protein
MVRIHSASAALVLVTLAASTAFAGAPPLAAAAAPSVLTGVVRDDVGKVLEGVEVLVLPREGTPPTALLRAVSDAGGRFFLESLSPGVYRVAAVKTGYIAALGVVNTTLRSSIDLVLRPIPKEGQPGSEKVLDDLKWTLRDPPRSILREIDPGAMLATQRSSGAREFAARMQEFLRGEVDQVLAVGSWRGGPSSAPSTLAGNETRMRFAGTLGDRGAIQLRGRHGSLDSASSPSTASAVSRGASDVDVDLSYDTGVDENLAMRAFYSAGDLTVDDRSGSPGGRQSQRSWGYDATWRKQVDASSNVALQVGFQDASLAPGQASASWDPLAGDAQNRAIGAEGSYQNLVGDGHLVRLGVRAQRLMLQAPDVRVGRDNGGLALDGATGWNLLIDSDDQWSVTRPFALTYGVTVRQGFEGTDVTTLAPRVGGLLVAGRVETSFAVSYVADAALAARSPYGYDVQWKGRLDPTFSLLAGAAYVPSRADTWGGSSLAADLGSVYLSDGLESDRYLAVGFERIASSAAVSFRVARGRAEGSLAPVLDEVPVAVLSDRALDYDAARLGVRVPRAGSEVALEYRSTREEVSLDEPDRPQALRTLDLAFAQELARFAGGRASCRLLVTARTALGGAAPVGAAEATDAGRFVAEHKRIGAGVSLAF